MQFPALNLNLPPKVKMYIGPLTLIFALLVGVLIGLAILKPAIENQKKLSAQKQDLAKKKDTMEKTLTNLKAIDYSQEQQRLADVELLIPSKSDLLQTMSFVESLAKRFGLEVLANRGAEGRVESKSKKLSGYAIQATFSGEYEKAREFLQALYQSKRAIGTSSITLAVQEDSTKISLTVTFFLPVSSETVKVDTFDSVVTSLSRKEEEMLQNLKKREIFIAATASATLGRPNPFAAP